MNELEDDLAIEEKLILDPVEEETQTADEVNIEDQIMDAVSKLSQEELDSEIDEKTLIDIATSEIDSIDTLNSRDLKMAFGEEVSELEIKTKSKEEDLENTIEKPSSIDIVANEQGIESLKNLLEALTDKNISATMSGMKISINIELGDTK